MATLCSGIGAPEVAASRVGGFQSVFMAEIEPFPCAVLKHHYPNVPNYGDMTKWRDWPQHDIDLLIAGTPCQAFSVAGLRNSLGDDRGNLTLEMARYADHARPRFLLWENVPGVLNTKDNAFGCLLGALAGSDAPLVPDGGRWSNEGFVSGPRRQIAWRVLDAQFFGVPQRRRRVWLVAGNVERGAGNWACAAALFPLREGLRWHPASCDTAGEGVAGTLGGGSGSRGTYWDGGQVSDTLDCSTLMNRQTMPDKRRFAAVLTAHTLRAAGHDASEAVPTVHDMRGNGDGATVPTLTGDHLNRPTDYTPCVAMPTGEARMVHWAQGGGDVEDDVSGALRANAEHSYQFVRTTAPTITATMQVRRLTVGECERLQGFPDGYTAVQHRGKPAADGPRYKALGNSMAVPCVEFILTHLKATTTGGAE